MSHGGRTCAAPRWRVHVAALVACSTSSCVLLYDIDRVQDTDAAPPGGSIDAGPRPDAGASGFDAMTDPGSCLLPAGADDVAALAFCFDPGDDDGEGGVTASVGALTLATDSVSDGGSATLGSDGLTLEGVIRMKLAEGGGKLPYEFLSQCVTSKAITFEVLLRTSMIQSQDLGNPLTLIQVIDDSDTGWFFLGQDFTTVERSLMIQIATSAQFFGVDVTSALPWAYIGLTLVFQESDASIGMLAISATAAAPMNAVMTASVVSGNPSFWETLSTTSVLVGNAAGPGDADMNRQWDGTLGYLGIYCSAITEEVLRSRAEELLTGL